MSKFNTWISAARPRTLPLSISGILVGTGLALREGFFDGQLFVFALLTTLGFQILSNFANDYGDGLKGTDNEERIGPIRALQSGIITDKEMKTAMIVTTVLTLLSAFILIFSAFNSSEIGYVILFFILGIASIGAAIKYTVGKAAYGYHGLGDLFVFLFFGLLGVVGSYFLYSKQLNGLVWLPAIIIGLLSTAVLNLNNMRDRKSDKNAGKHTLVVTLGGKRAKHYHYSLVFMALLLTLFYNILEFYWFNTLLFIAFIPLLLHLRVVYRTKTPQELDPEMKKVALSTVFFALTYLLTGLF